MPAVTSEQILETIAAIAHRIPTSPALESLLNEVVQEVKARLNSDRVVIVRGPIAANDAINHTANDALILAESMSPDGVSLLRQQVDPDTSHLAQVDIAQPDPVEQSKSSQAQASFAVPIRSESPVWGWLVVYHWRSPRQWHALEIQLLEQVALQLGLAVGQDNLRQQLALSVNSPTPATPTPQETLLQQVAENIPQLLLMREAKSGQFLYVNSSYEKIWGRTCESLYQDPQSWLAAIHPDDREQVDNSLKQQFQGAPVEREYRIIRPNGDCRWIIAKVIPILDPAGHVSRFVGWAEDVTERKQLALELQASQARLHDILNSTIAAIAHIRVFANHQFKIEYCSQGCEQIFGFTAEEFLAEPNLWRSRVFPEDLETVIAPALSQLFAGQTLTLEYRFRHRDGKMRWISDTLTSQWDQSANCWLVTVIGTDISERKQTEAALRQQAEREALLLKQVQQLNTTLEQQVLERTSQLQQSSNLEALLKRITDKVRDSLDESQILQTAVEELVVVLAADICEAAFYDLHNQTVTICYECIRAEVPAFRGAVIPMEKLIAVHQQILQGQIVHFCSITPLLQASYTHGSRFCILGCPLVDETGVFGNLWVFRLADQYFNDLETRLVQQVANQCAIALRQSRLYQSSQAQVHELERLNRLKDDFLSSISHELRTPMSSIKMATQMLKISLQPLGILEDETAPIHRYLHILQEECQREITLIDDLLGLVRLDAGTEPLHLLCIRLQIVISHIAEPFINRAHQQQQQFKIIVAEDLPAITTDLPYLERILVELLDNACKYTPPGETITVNAQPSTTGPIISVSNSGVEISQTECDRIFDRFYRIPNNDPWKHSGTGLGLALVKRLVETLKGDIQVESHSGQTTFTIHLPYLLTDTTSKSA